MENGIAKLPLGNTAMETIHSLAPQHVQTQSGVIALVHQTVLTGTLPTIGSSQSSVAIAPSSSVNASATGTAQNITQTVISDMKSSKRYKKQSSLKFNDGNID